MLERDDCLWTWQLPWLPREPSDFPLMAVRIQDHRKAYLSYEGDVREDQGQVARVEEGTLRYDLARARRIEVTLNGQRLAGRFVLTLCGSNTWNIAAVDAGGHAATGLP